MKYCISPPDILKTVTSHWAHSKVAQLGGSVDPKTPNMDEPQIIATTRKTILSLKMNLKSQDVLRNLRISFLLTKAQPCQNLGSWSELEPQDFFPGSFKKNCHRSVELKKSTATASPFPGLKDPDLLLESLDFCFQGTNFSDQGEHVLLGRRLHVFI